MTQPDPDQAAKAEAIEFAHRLLGRWQEVLGTELVGAYLIGSLAHDGFSRRYSDVDLGLITTAGLGEAMLARLREEAAALSAAWGPKVSISGPTVASPSGAFRHSIASTISTMR